MNRNGHTKAQLTETLHAEQETNLLLQERIAELERDDIGWQRLSGEFDREFSREYLGELIWLSRLLYLKNPLIQRAARVQAHYVFGQGVTAQSRDEDVQRAIQRLWDDPGNQRELTGHQALLEKEAELTVTGNLFLVMFPDVLNGTVAVRSIPVEEITEIVTDPDDARTPWYYRRQWSESRLNSVSGVLESQPKTAWYPDAGYRPPARQMVIGGNPVEWASPVMHVRVGGMSHMRFGVPEHYAAFDWAGAVKRDLEDFATIRRAHARFAWSLTPSGGKKGIAAAQKRMGTTLGTGTVETNPPPTAGAMFVGDGQLSPIRTANSQPHPEDSRRMWLMVAAGTGIPETILSGNADVGNLATARTLDRPTELQMRDRQNLWRAVLMGIIDYAIDTDTLAVKGILRGGTRTLDEETGRVVVRVPEGTERHVDVDFPSILDRSPQERVDAIVRAATLGSQGQPKGTLSPRLLSQLLLQALGVDDADEELERLFPDGTGTERELPAPPPQLGQDEDEDEGDPTEVAQREAAFVAALNDVRRLVERGHAA